MDGFSVAKCWKQGKNLLVLHAMQKRLRNLDCVFYVGVAMDEQYFVDQSGCETQRYLTEELG